jgi:hypothetical protein
MIKSSVKSTSIIAAMLFAVATPASAGGKSWNVTEEGFSGIKGAQGEWAVNVDGDKITGAANMQLATGATLTYTIDGSVKDSVYTVKLSNRTDGKNGCVWTGQAPAGDDAKTHGLIGKVACDGNAGFTIRAAF